MENFTTKDVAEMFRVDMEDVRDWIHSGSLIANKGDDRKWQISKDSLTAYLGQEGKRREIMLRCGGRNKIRVLVFAAKDLVTYGEKTELVGIDELSRNPDFAVDIYDVIPASLESLKHILYDCVIMDFALGVERVFEFAQTLRTATSQADGQKGLVLMNVWCNAFSATGISDPFLFDDAYYRSSTTVGLLMDKIKQAIRSISEPATV